VASAALLGERPPPHEIPASVPAPGPLPVADSTRAQPVVIAVAAAPTLINLRPISFQYRSARLSAKARQGLDGEALPKIAFGRETRVVVKGYSDRIASSRYNQRLSQRRAEAVRDH